MTFFPMTFLSGCNMNYLDYSQHIESPDGLFNYCLYFDGVGVGDPGYYILKLEKSIDPEKKSIDPEKVKINWSFKNGSSTKDLEWIRRKQILFNYDEAGLFTSNPNLEVINKRHLVFSRGGYYFGLYDMKSQKDTFNVSSPWNEWREQSGFYSERYDEKKEKAEYGQWIQNNLHNKIQAYIVTNN